MIQCYIRTLQGGPVDQVLYQDRVDSLRPLRHPSPNRIMAVLNLLGYYFFIVFI